MADANTPPELPSHVEESVWSIARIHAEHHQNATPLQRAVNRVTAFLGHPRFIAVLTVVLIGWITLNSLAAPLGRRPIDPPPFSWLQGAISLVSFYMVVLILATQRHADQLAERRDQLTLELVVMSEQKVAKVIQLLEEFRRDNPLVHDRVDREADAMAQPADPPSVLDVIRQTHAEVEKVVDP